MKRQLAFQLLRLQPFSMTLVGLGDLIRHALNQNIWEPLPDLYQVNQLSR